MEISDFINLKSIIGTLIGSIATIKAINITINSKRNNVEVTGNNNNVTITQQLERVQGSFTLLWNVFFILVCATYPSWGNFYNSLLVTSAIFAIPLSVFWFFAVLRSFGLKRIWDFWYIIGIIVACWFVYCSAYYLPSASQNASKIPLLIKYLLNNGPSLSIGSTQETNVLRFLLAAISQSLGFVLIFLPFGYLIFSFVKERSFDDALKRIIYAAMCPIGYLLVAGLFVVQDITSVKFIFLHAIPPIPGILS